MCVTHRTVLLNWSVRMPVFVASLVLCALFALILIVFRVTSYLQQAKVLESGLQMKQHEITVTTLREESTQLIKGLQEVSTTLAAALTNRSVETLAPQISPSAEPYSFEVEDDSDDYVLAEDGSNEVISYEEDNILLGLIPQD